ncbi:MAG TPA: dihydrolipoamide acetyltransferase family protein [Candidatus Eisenbacteria bacterium]|jgi:pyruvate dehydrogenase E2 component (dihydrolipoamide acetyltransferase)
MPYDVKLPDIGEGIAEGEIVRWLVKPGDPVREDQPLVEVMTDKATVEIPSPRSGTIAALRAREGEVVPVGSAIVTIALAGEEAAGAAMGAGAATAAGTGDGSARDAPDPDELRWNDEGGAIPTVVAAMQPVPAAEPGSAGAAPTGRVQAAPAVRQLAKQLGVALGSVAGSGPGGAITAADVKRAAAGAGAATEATPAGGTGIAGAARVAAAAGAAASALAAASAAPTAKRRAPSGAAVEAQGAAPAGGAPAAAPAGTEAAEAGRIPLRGLRRRIAEHMRHSLDTAAHFTFVAECDMTAVVEHRERMKERAEARGVKLTFLPYVALALVEPLRRHPLLNARLDDERGEIVLLRDLHLGIATATKEGLTVPVIRNADRLGLFALAGEIRRLAEAARAHRLKLEELQGGTFTMTSTGARGGLLATPIIHHPQVAILGVHEVKKKPAVVDGAIVARDLTNLSLALDHRVVDGAVGADFLYAVIERLERPERWLGEEALA